MCNIKKLLKLNHNLGYDVTKHNLSKGEGGKKKSGRSPKAKKKLEETSSR